MFVYGTQFYRPPSPPREERRQALEQIAHVLKFNTIKIWVMWNWCNPEPDRYDFDEVEEIMSICDQLELRVVVNTILETAPYWLDERYPEARYVNARGEALELRGRSSDPSGGWPGLCSNHPQVSQSADQFLRAVAGVVRPHASMFGYDCWNEPHVEPAWFNSMWPQPEQLLFCYCPSTQLRFVAWLKNKYQDIEALNDAWVRRFRDWQDVLPPKTHGTYADWLDWRRFMIQNMTEHMEARARVLHDADPDHFIMSHAAKFQPLDAVSITVTNGWDLAEAVDRWGCAFFPKWHRMNAALVAGKLDVCRSNAHGKPWWVAELQGGHGMTTGLQRGPQVLPRDIRLWNWLALAAGAKGIVYWNYMAEATGIEATGFGLLDRSRNITDRAEEASRNCAIIQKYKEILSTWEPEPQVAVLYDQDNHILAFAMDGNEHPATGSALGYYRAIWQSDVWAHFIQPDDVHTLPSHIKVIIVPWHLIAKRDTLLALDTFVRQGGVLIVDTALGLFDVNGVHKPDVPPSILQHWGIKEKEAFWLPDEKQPATLWERLAPMSVPASADITPLDEVYSSPHMEFIEPLSTTVRPRVFLTPLELSPPAQAVAWYQNLVVAAQATIGQGKIYYFGTNMGTCIHQGDEGALAIVKAIIAAHTSPSVRGDRLRPRMIRRDDEALVIVVNPTTTSISEAIALPQDYDNAVDVHTNLPIDLINQEVHVHVEGQDVKVIALWSKETQVDL